MSGMMHEALRMTNQMHDILELVSNTKGRDNHMQKLTESIDRLSAKAQSGWTNTIQGAWLTTCSTEVSDEAILDWLSPPSHSQRHYKNRNSRVPHTGEWLLACETFKEWSVGKTSRLYCTGGPGAGKSVLTYVVSTYLGYVALRTDSYELIGD